jgi:hypothetical protein
MAQLQRSLGHEPHDERISCRPASLAIALASADVGGIVASNGVRLSGSRWSRRVRFTDRFT